MQAKNERIEGRVVSQIIEPGYFAEEIIADGPWEARFKFCAKYGVSPDKVSVSPEIRVPGYEYWCSVGKMDKFNYHHIRSFVDHLTTPIKWEKE